MKHALCRFCKKRKKNPSSYPDCFYDDCSNIVEVEIKKNQSPCRICQKRKKDPYCLPFCRKGCILINDYQNRIMMTEKRVDGIADRVGVDPSDLGRYRFRT